MATKDFYKITITNFKKHNATLKKGHKATLISHNFCQDAKLSTVPLTTRWLFLNLLLTCGDMHSDTVELSEKALRDMLECRRNIVSVLESLQSLRVLTFEKITPFIIEKKRKEEKRKEKKGIHVDAVAPAVEILEPESTAHFFITTYCELFSAKYGSNPTILKKDAGIAKRLSAGMSSEKVKRILGAYFQLPDSWVIKRKHPIDSIESKMNEITVFLDSGKYTTQTELRQIDNQNIMSQTYAAIERGEV